MGNLKTVILVFGASVILVVLMAVGLTKLSGGGTGTVKVAEDELTTGARWIKANGDTKVTVVEFSDIQCPACKAAEPISVILRDTPGVKFIYRHFPLVTIHPNAWKGARALEAVHLIDADKAWKMMETMFANQEKWAGEGNPDKFFSGYAKEIGVDEKLFTDKYNSDESDKLVGEDSSLGNRLQLSGTPTFFVNGEQIAAPAVLDKVKELLK